MKRLSISRKNALKTHNNNT